MKAIPLEALLPLTPLHLHSHTQRRWSTKTVAYLSKAQTNQEDKTPHIVCLLMQRTGLYHVTQRDRSSLLASLLCLHLVPPFLYSQLLLLQR